MGAFDNGNFNLVAFLIISRLFSLWDPPAPAPSKPSRAKN
ncbi:MAG: hypothetical protein ACI923_001423, partial [Flavobacteriales bacterium]